MPVPGSEEIRRPLLESLDREEPRNLSVKDFLSIAARRLSINLEDMSTIEKAIFKRNIERAKDYLTKHKLISNPANQVYMITASGREVVRGGEGIIDEEVIRRVNSFGEPKDIDAQREEEPLPGNMPDATPLEDLSPVMSDVSTNEEALMTGDSSQDVQLTDDTPEDLAQDDQLLDDTADASLQEAPLPDTLDLTDDDTSQEDSSHVDRPEEPQHEETFPDDLDLTDDTPDASVQEDPLLDDTPEDLPQEEAFPDDLDLTDNEPAPQDNQLQDDTPEDSSQEDSLPDALDLTDEELDYDETLPQQEVTSLDNSAPTDDTQTQSHQEYEVYEHMLPQEQIEAHTPLLEDVLAEHNSQLAQKVLARTANLPSDTFEVFVTDLLSKMGYRAFYNARYTSDDNDNGMIHGVILDPKAEAPLYIHAEKLSPDQTVGRADVQDFVNALADKGGKGIFATTALFSDSAASYAQDERILLIDGPKLAGLMISHNFCVNVEKVFEVKELDEDSFSDYES